MNDTTVIYLNDSITNEGLVLNSIPIATLLKVEICFSGECTMLEKYLNCSIDREKLFDKTYCPQISNYVHKFSKNSIVCILESKTNNDYESYEYNIIRQIAFVFSIRKLSKNDHVITDSFNCSNLEIGKKLIEKNANLIKDVETEYLLTRDNEATLLSFSIDLKNKKGHRKVLEAKYKNIKE